MRKSRSRALTPAPSRNRASTLRRRTRTQDQDVKDSLLHNTEAFVARGNFGSPTFFVGDEMFFGKDCLRDVEEEIIAQGKTEFASARK